MRKIVFLFAIIILPSILLISNPSVSAAAECPDSWPDPNLQINLTSTDSVNSFGFKRQIWDMKRSSSYSVRDKVKQLGIDPINVIIEEGYEVDDSSSFSKPKNFAWEQVENWSSGVPAWSLRSEDGGNPQVSNHSWIRQYVSIQMKGCPTTKKFVSNSFQFTNLLNQVISIEDYFSKVPLAQVGITNFLQTSYITENLHNLASTFSKGFILDKPVSSSSPFIFDVPWIRNMSVQGGGPGGRPNLMVAGMNPTECVEPYGSTSGPPIDPTGFKFNSFPCEVGIYLWIPDSQLPPPTFQLVQDLTVDARIAAKPSPTPSTTAISTPSTTTSASTAPNAPVKKVSTWSCVKGKTSLKFSGSSIVCPTGYKVKK